MAGYTLPPAHLTAGRDYLNALRKLGLDPDGLLWAYDHSISEFVLALVTGQFDYVGPTEIYEMLTRAYNAAATPSLISPFIVRLHSPKQEIVRVLREAYGWEFRVDQLDEKGMPMDVPEAKISNLTAQVEDLSFQREWVYLLSERKAHAAERARRWRRFKGNVSALAA